MRTYDFNEKLSWPDFQNLACEVVQQREHIRLQTFKDTADDGADGLWFDETSMLVVQAKKYKDFKTLYRELKNIELQKVKKLNPDRYILVVSLELGKHEADKIYELFEGYIKTSGDLITKNELNCLLAEKEYHRIEKDYTRLWLPDTAVIEEALYEIVHKGARNRNTNAYRKALNTSRTFVQTQTYNHALAKLNANHTIVISGEPGMGKTTLAYILALEFLSVRGYEGFIWAETVEEIEAGWEYSEQRQVFILDDYWGSTFHKETGRKATRKLEELIYRVKDDENKRLIITSREYIVQQEISRSPELKDIVSRLKLECVLKDYSAAEKAKILFAHLYASDLETEYLEDILFHCDKIVENEGYSPRIIEKFLKQSDCEEFSPQEYTDELMGYLDYPENFWNEIFTELTEEARIIALIIAISYVPISLEDIRNTFGKYVKLYAAERKIKSFEVCISELEKTFVTTFWDEEILITFENPSIIDFLFSFLEQNQEYYVPKLCRVSSFYNQLLMLLERDICKDEEIIREIEQRAVDEFYNLPMKISDFGEIEVGESELDQGSDWAGRAFHLLRVSKLQKRGPVWPFIRKFVNEFSEQLGRNELFDGVDELIDFIGLLRLCEKNGMHFDGWEIMEQYWSCSFLAIHYAEFAELGKLYPEEFEERREGYVQFMKKNIKDIILYSLDYLDELGCPWQMDMLVDNVPRILKEFGLRYTQKYKMQIKMIAGRYYEEIKRDKKFDESSGWAPDPEEEDYEKAKQEGYELLLGEEDEGLEPEECMELIKKLNFSPELEEDLLSIVESGEPWYISETLETEELLVAVKKWEDQQGLKKLPRSVDFFMILLLYQLWDGEVDISDAFLGFCTGYTLDLLLYKTSSRVSETKFRKLEVYKTYIAGNPKLEELLFRTVLVKRGKWVETRNELLMVYCCSRVLVGGEDFDRSIFFEYDMMFSDYFKKDKDGGLCIYSPQLNGGFKRNYKWERWLALLFKELDGERFYMNYVIPQVKKFLAQFRPGEERIVDFLKESRLQLEVERDNEIGGDAMTVSDVIILIENLGIASITGEFADRLTKKEIKYLTGRKSICKKKKDRTVVSVFQENNVDFLKKCGVYGIVRQFFYDLECFVNQFPIRTELQNEL